MVQEQMPNEAKLLSDDIDALATPLSGNEEEGVRGPPLSTPIPSAEEEGGAVSSPLPPLFTHEEVLCSSLGIPAPQTPPAKVSTLSSKLSPWTKQKIAVGARDKVINKNTKNKSIAAKPSDVKSSAQNFGPYVVVDAMWKGMKCNATTAVLLLAWQTEVSQTGWANSLSFTAWGLSPTNSWVKVVGWGEMAMALAICLASCSTEKFGHVMFSKTRHLRDAKKPVEGCLALKLENDCEFKWLQNFPDSESSIIMDPKPSMNSNWQDYFNAPDNLRTFLCAKVHQIYDSDHQDRLSVLLEDLSGNAVRASIWAPCSSSNLWTPGRVVTILGMTVRRQWNQFSLSSDGVVVEDVNTPAENFPEEITPTQWPKPENCL